MMAARTYTDRPDAPELATDSSKLTTVNMGEIR